MNARTHDTECGEIEPKQPEECEFIEPGCNVPNNYITGVHEEITTLKQRIWVHELVLLAACTYMYARNMRT